MRFRWLVHYLAFALWVGLLWGCSPKHADIVVMELGPEKVRMEEYERLYQRNSGTWDAAQKSTLDEREKFLDLLMKYRLKLLDAYARRLDTDREVVAELHDHRTNLATTFMLEKELAEPGVRRMYERRKEELRASHILLRVGPTASPEETLKVYNRAMELIHLLRQGMDFAALADSVSEDPSAKTNKGDLYYFTGGNMVTPFEDAVYALKPGEMAPLPVRTNYGYHIIKLTDRKPSAGSIHARHIMAVHKHGTQDSAAVDSALIKIRQLQDSLRAGADFAELAQRYSDDPGSASRGGDLGTFPRRRFVQEFEEVAFKLKPGQVSDVVKTGFGYHLIKCEGFEPIPPFEEMKPELQKLFQQFRYNDEYRKFVERYKQQLGYAINDSVVNEFISYIDSTRFPSDSGWASTVPTSVRQAEMLRAGPRSITVDSIVEMMSARAEFRDAPLIPAKIPGHIARAGDLIVLDLASSGLEERYPKFKRLMKEFHDGVVLYRGEQMEVWNKIKVDEPRLRAFFEEHRDQYTFPDRIDITEISANSESLATVVYGELKRGASVDTVAARHQGQLRKNARGLIPTSTDSLTGHAWSYDEGSFFGPILHRGSYTVVVVNKKDPNRQKTLQEASAEVSTAFQDYEAKRLETEWIDQLRARYPVVLHKEVLMQAFKGEPPSED